ncbi:MAG: DUF1361 domain-containing protein [Bacteroidetes bacterium]|nr:DUF1361 domain-containing protein [Bacteroidota bacterium]
MTQLAFSFTIRKSLFLRTELDRLLTSSMFFSCMLVFIRVFHTGRPIFIFMIWNLFLAYIPYALSTWLTARYGPGRDDSNSPLGDQRWGSRRARTFRAWIRRLRKRRLLIVLSFVWLLFIPNAFYMLTDLYHLSDGSGHRKVPEWFDLALILSFAFNGLLLGVLSVRHMEKLFLPNPTVVGSWLFVFPIMVLNALGVYTGRYLRYNSWDIVSDPWQLIRDMTGMVVHPLRNHPVWSMVLCFSVLLMLIYRLLQRGSKALA